MYHFSVVEVIGYSARAVNANESPDWSTGAYATQSLMLLLAPTLFAASIYMILARIVKLTDGEQHSVIRVKWLTPTFVAGDVLSFLTQSGGRFHIFILYLDVIRLINTD